MLSVYVNVFSVAKTVKKSQTWTGAQLTICAQKLRNFVFSSTLSLRFVCSRVSVFLHSLGPRSFLSQECCHRMYFCTLLYGIVFRSIIK